jgi:hypothetical protein
MLNRSMVQFRSGLYSSRCKERDFDFKVQNDFFRQEIPDTMLSSILTSALARFLGTHWHGGRGSLDRSVGGHDPLAPSPTAAHNIDDDEYNAGYLVIWSKVTHPAVLEPWLENVVILRLTKVSHTCTSGLRFWATRVKDIATLSTWLWGPLEREKKA